MSEQWLDVKGYEGFYQVSNLGRVKSLDREVLFCGKIGTRKGILLKQCLSKSGYLRVLLSKQGVKKNCCVHRLVAKAFCYGESAKANTVNHKDLDKTNNRVENLEWCSSQENRAHAVLNKAHAYGERSAKAKLTKLQVSEIRSLYFSKENKNCRRIDMPYPITALAKTYCVTPQAIYQIVKGNTHKL